MAAPARRLLIGSPHMLVRTLSHRVEPNEATLIAAAEAVGLHSKEVPGCVAFIGTGQYFDGGAAALRDDYSKMLGTSARDDLERFIVCLIGDDLRNPYNLVEICDEVLPGETGADALESALLVNGASTVVRGEVDCLDNGDWEHGSFHESMFGVFDRDGDVTRFGYDGDSAALWTRRDAPYSKLHLESIECVSIDVSDDLAIRTINMCMRDGAKVPVLAHDVCLDMRSLASHPDAALMASTQWLVKAAAGYTLQLRRFGVSASLMLPKKLTAEGNEFVQQRNAAWKAGIS